MAIGASQPPWRGADFLVMIDNSSKGPMKTAGRDLGTSGMIRRFRNWGRDGRSSMRYVRHCRRGDFRSRNVLPR